MKGNRMATLERAQGCPGFLALVTTLCPLLWDAAHWGPHVVVNDLSLQT